VQVSFQVLASLALVLELVEPSLVEVVEVGVQPLPYPISLI